MRGLLVIITGFLLSLLENLQEVFRGCLCICFALVVLAIGSFILLRLFRAELGFLIDTIRRILAQIQ